MLHQPGEHAPWPISPDVWFRHRGDYQSHRSGNRPWNRLSRAVHSLAANPWAIERVDMACLPFCGDGDEDDGDFRGPTHLRLSIRAYRSIQLLPTCGANASPSLSPSVWSACSYGLRSTAT